MAKLIPIAVILVAALGGGAAGHLLRPAPAEAVEDAAPRPEPAAPEKEAFVTFRDGFIVPVLRDGQVWGHVILTLGAKAGHTAKDDILLREPLLRDGLNQALFLHASLGGFDGDFTTPQVLKRLRSRLDEVLVRELSDETARILLVSMARQAT
ncbi:hypothetical protein MWU52_11890 [Jannaschia sp. S6380]|uniref:hypothetical protein n=1 Tax=Jannaschia sp. S6380 TaxID=2926408 RepID=UPI001FF5F2AD|nr:hypothetical protein [Jannaschia sp. S6380]MCK0168257.1 hypothetical protein [Jannaschia sp. S6380]